MKQSQFIYLTSCIFGLLSASIGEPLKGFAIASFIAFLMMCLDWIAEWHA